MCAWLLTGRLASTTTVERSPRQRQPSHEGCRPPLQYDDLPVVRALHVGLVPAAEHVRAHVGENDSPGVEPLTILTEGLESRWYLTFFSKKYASQTKRSAPRAASTKLSVHSVSPE